MNPLDAVRGSAAELGLPGARVLVAASGGADSTVLLCALSELAPELGIELVAAHVNHGLRGADADADEALVAAHAARLGWPFARRRVTPEAWRAGRSSRARPTLQEACRRARYDALFEMAAEHGAARIATAHTLDDQAETILLRLVRGAGPAGLCGIAPHSQDGRVVRPLLALPRAAIERWARARCLAWREDASNRDPAYARARLRASGVRVWAERENPAWLGKLAELAETQRREEEWLAGIVEREAARLFSPCEGGLLIAAAGWDARPHALALRLARHALRRLGAARDVSRVHLARCAAFWVSARPGTHIELPGGLRLARERAAFRLTRESAVRDAPQTPATARETGDGC